MLQAPQFARSVFGWMQTPLHMMRSPPQRQAPPEQTCPPPQDVAQPPQCEALLLVSTQLSPHARKPDAQLVMHLLPEQTCALPQVTPQLPQFLESFARFTHEFPQRLPLAQPH